MVSAAALAEVAGSGEASCSTLEGALQSNTLVADRSSPSGTVVVWLAASFVAVSSSSYSPFSLSKSYAIIEVLRCCRKSSRSKIRVDI